MTGDQQYGFQTRKQEKQERVALFLCGCKQWLGYYMHEDSNTVERFAVGGTDGFPIGVGLHQKSILSLFMFAVVMDRLADEVRQDSQQ